MPHKILFRSLSLGGLVFASILTACQFLTNPLSQPASPSPYATPPPTATSSPSADDSSLLTPLQTTTQTAAPSETPLPTASHPLLPLATSTITSTPDPASILEDFNASFDDWKVLPGLSGSGSVIRTSDLFVEGMAAARLDLPSGPGSAALQINFRDAALDHTWDERPGTWNWFRVYVYVPSSTISGLGGDDYLTLGGIFSSGEETGWYLRLHQGGAVYVVGHRDWDNKPIEFQVFANFPQDRWVQLELGLHSQSGPGVKRAFAFLIDGDFYGWYNQGRMKDEVYDTASVGILSASSAQPLTVYVDDWFRTTQDAFPSGSDNRSASPLQEQDFRIQDGRQWQIDWGTWENHLLLAPYLGLYSPDSRFQVGRNLERMPPLASGWAEIESDWPQGIPPSNNMLTYSFGGLIAFHKEINREENLEVGYALSDGVAQVYYSAWTGEPLLFGLWRLPPSAALSDSRNLPEPGDILRVRWEQVGEKELHVSASFFDASAEKWYPDIIDDTRDLTSLPDADPPGGTINYMDDFHLASAITVDTPYYSIHYYRVSTLETYPAP